jgi:nitrogen fixation protein NifZ
MTLDDLQPGDIIFAANRITNDGSVPGLPENAVIAEPGTRGVLVNKGLLEAQPNLTIYLVRFEQPDGDLGPPTGCWAEELAVTGEEPA